MAKYTDYLPAQCPPWLQDAAVGTPWMAQHGSLLDDFAGDLKNAVKARFPQNAFADALPVLGSERQIDRGLNDTDAAYALRLVNAWTTWPAAGSAYSILVALGNAGYTFTNGNPVSVQQNGIYYYLDGTNTLQRGSLGNNPAIGGNQPVANLTTPWWTFDSSGLDANNNQFNSRFAIIFAAPPSSWTTILSVPTNVSSPAIPEVNAIRRTIKKWAAGKATLVHIGVLQTGRLWGWPLHAWGDGIAWGGTGVVWLPTEQ